MCCCVFCRDHMSSEHDDDHMHDDDEDDDHDMLDAAAEGIFDHGEGQGWS